MRERAVVVAGAVGVLVQLDRADHDAIDLDHDGALAVVLVLCIDGQIVRTAVTVEVLPQVAIGTGALQLDQLAFRRLGAIHGAEVVHVHAFRFHGVFLARNHLGAAVEAVALEIAEHAAGNAACLTQTGIHIGDSVSVDDRDGVGHAVVVDVGIDIVADVAIDILQGEHLAVRQGSHDLVIAICETAKLVVAIGIGGRRCDDVTIRVKQLHFDSRLRRLDRGDDAVLALELDLVDTDVFAGVAIDPQLNFVALVDLHVLQHERGE